MYLRPVFKKFFDESIFLTHSLKQSISHPKVLLVL